MATAEKTTENAASIGRKGNAKTEAIIGKAAHKLATAHTSLTEALKQASTLQQLVDDATIAVTHKELELAEIEVKLNNAKAQADVELDLYKKTKAQDFVNEFLEKEGMQSVDKVKYAKLYNDYNSLQAEFENKLAAEVGKTKGILTSQFTSDVKLKEAEFNTKEATNKATIESLTNQLSAARNDAARWQQQLEAERTAQTERAKASAVGAVNINTPNGR
jgi:alpha-glucosidase (family GH31 glycosyl hydrolase)